MKSVREQLKEFLQREGGVWPSGELQRKEWRNRRGSLATPRSIVRRLQELAEDGEIHVEWKNGHAHYSFAAPVPSKPTLQPVYIKTAEGEVVRLVPMN